MKKPIKKDYCKPFSLDSNLVTFNSKQYAKDAEKYIQEIEDACKNYRQFYYQVCDLITFPPDAPIETTLKQVKKLIK